MNIPEASIKNYQFTLLLFLVLLILGIYSFSTMRRAEDPSVNVPQVAVTAIYPGATPQDIERQVTDVLEASIQELDDLVEVETYINDAMSFSRVEFVHGVDVDQKYDDVQRQVNAVLADLPMDLYDLQVTKFSTSTVSMIQLALVSETASYERLQTVGEDIQELLEGISGVRKVSILGYPEKEVRISLNAVKMANMNISLEDIERAIKSSNANIPGGAIKLGGKQFNIKTSGAYQDLEEIRNTVVGSYQGKLIYLKHIAETDFEYEDERWLARFNGKRSIIVTVQPKDAVNVFSVTAPIEAALAAYSLPNNMQLHYVFNQAEGVQERISSFLSNLIQGIVLVGLLIFLLLGVRSASLIMLAIPFSILIGLAAVNFFGFGLQQISIAGLVVALGLLVDNSIAVIENIERFLHLGLSPREAAIKGTQQLVAPITSATLTTILAFIPIIMMPDMVGEFIQSLPVTVIATLVASLLVAITLTPFIARHWLKVDRTGTKQPMPVFRLLKRFVEGPYRNILHWAMGHKGLVILITVVSFVGSLALFPLVGLSFFPKAEKGQLLVSVRLPNGSNIDASNEAAAYVESVLAQRDEVKYYATNVGHTNPRIYYNVVGEVYQTNFAQLFVTLKQYEVNEFARLKQELRQTFSSYPNARIDVTEFIQGPPSPAPIEVKIFGNELDLLRTYAKQVEEVISETAGAINVSNQLSTYRTDLHFRINRDKAMLLGVPIHEIDRSIRAFVAGAEIGTFRDQNAKDYKIILRYKSGSNFQLEDFDQLSIKSLSGRFIPLKQLASLEFEEASSRVQHLDGERMATVLSDLKDSGQLNQISAQIAEKIDELQLNWEEGYTYMFKGDIEAQNDSFGSMGIASAIAFLLIFSVLVIQFKSFVQPLIIFSALPLAIIGSILALLVTNIPFSFTAFVGITSLIGIAINDSIVLVDFANKLRDEGASVLDAILQAGEIRFIPVLTTTLTTILGLLPLTLRGGSLWAPMGWTIIGGLLTSTVFILVLIPILYKIFTPEVSK